MTVSYVVSTIITAGKRFITAVCNGKSDVRTPWECAPAGLDSSPIADMQAIYSRTNSVNQPGVIVGYVNKHQQAASGEYRFYSTNSNGDVQASGWLHADGSIVYTGTTIELLGNANHATQYEALNTQLQNMITAINVQLGLIATGVSGGGGSYTPGDLSLDLTSAKLTNIKTQ